jgi:hypothetical protein
MSSNLVTPAGFGVVALGKGLDGKARYGVRFSLQWNPPTPGPIPSLGVLSGLDGNYFIFDPTTLGSLEIGEIKSIAINSLFTNPASTDSPLPDGDLYIYDSATGATLEFGPGIMPGDSQIITGFTGVISLPSGNHSRITFAKGEVTALSLCFGRTDVTLFNYEIPTWLSPVAISNVD